LSSAARPVPARWSATLARCGWLIVIVDMRLAGVFVAGVLVRGVRMPHGRMVVFVLVGGAEVLKATGYLVVVVCDVVVPVGVHQLLVVVLFPPSGRVLRHGCSLVSSVAHVLHRGAREVLPGPARRNRRSQAAA
jgi:hypothetical protein